MQRDGEHEEADLFKAGLFSDTIASGRVRGFEIGVTEWNSRSHLA